MRFSESRIVKVSKNLQTNLCINFAELGIDFFSIDNMGNLPETISVELSAKTKSLIMHEFFGQEGVNWYLDSDHHTKKFLQEFKAVENDKLIIQKIGPAEYRISPLCEDFSFIDLFAGIGGIRIGFESIGGKCVFSSEWDEQAQISYAANFGETPAGDITKVDENDIPEHDVLVGGFPCQPFSIIGNRAGFADTRGTLFFEIERILQKHRPKAILLENVKQFKTHDQGRTCQTVLDSLKNIGYNTHTTILNALDFGVAQKRERTFIVGFLENIDFRFPKAYTYQPKLEHILEPEDMIHKSLIASQKIQEKRLSRLLQQGRTPFYPSIWHENKGGHIGIHPFSCALRHNASYNYLLVNGKRRPSGREMLRLLGYPEKYKIVVDHMAIRAQAGNSVAVPVITAIAAEMAMSMKLSTTKIKSPNQGLLFA